MKKSKAIKYFGSSSKLAKQLNISKQSISQWGEEIPPRRAFELERITSGVLEAIFFQPPILILSNSNQQNHKTNSSARRLGPVTNRKRVSE